MGIGIVESPGGVGASLHSWREYFPKGQIYGADIVRENLFQKERIQTFYCDALKEQDIRDMWNNDVLKDKQFDVILDDGMHTTESIVKFFKNSIHKLKIGGVFIAEDLGVQMNEDQWKNYAENLQTEYPFLRLYFLRVEQCNKYVGDNCVLVAQKISAENN
jgi:hypothetical protein